MTHEKWFLGCHHLFHSNMLKFVKDDGTRCRPFNSLEEMHSLIIKNHNDNVKDNDYVYFLGDLTFRYDGAFNNIMSQLKGKKRLIVGNHDKIWNPALQKWFEKCEFWKGFPEGNFTASHMPMLLDSLRDGTFNVHAHVHWRSRKDPRYINVCVEVRDYTPVHMDTILKEIKERS